MAAIHDLLAQIQDEELRVRIEKEVDKLSKTKKFGLVFEEHLPECTVLYDIPVKRGALVAKRIGSVSNIYTVLSIKNEIANCCNRSTGVVEEINVDDLVCVAEFGDPIYPYLKPIDSVCNAPESDLWHTLIEADNYHALQLLEYLYAGTVDCIYIDPPYNTGARDWKYNNDYVDSSDAYRHSKWLSFIEKRLRLAKKLLNPVESVLIVTIDEKEYLHLGCLLEDLFPEAKMQMISTVINPSGVAREGEFYRTDEYVFILRFGSCVPSKLQLSEEWLTAKSTGKDSVRWRPIRRQGSHDTRLDAPNQFYPIYLSEDGTHVVGTGASLSLDENINNALIPDGVIAIWPIKPSGEHGCWQISQESIEKLLSKGYIKVSHTDKWGFVPQYLAEGERKKVESGLFRIIGKDKYGTVILADADGLGAPFIPGTQWRISSHSAREQGSSLLNRIFPDKRFSFPKSLYAVHDVLKFFVVNKPNALIVDFFAGSGTTLHAINLLNAEDGGKRRCILVTNNEVSELEASNLRSLGYAPGDEEWEKHGIARYVTWPRTLYSIKGTDINGIPLKGEYLGCDIPMSSGFRTNAVFFKLGFLDKTSVALGKQLNNLSSLLWMKAGACGACPVLDEKQKAMFILPDNHFAILVDEKSYQDFVEEIRSHPEIQTIFIVTDSESGYKDMISAFQDKETYQLYRDYLDNFRINVKR